jgi:hypothetical protein
MAQMMTIHETLAWICWRSKRAVKAFSGEMGAFRWQDALEGRYPPGLRAPKVKPREAQDMLLKKLQSGELPAYANISPRPAQH